MSQFDLRNEQFQYKDFIGGGIEWNEDRSRWRGKILNITDLVDFVGNTPEELEAAFRDSVDDYLEMCSDLGKAPQ